ncbi:hypothetical protein JW921_02925 [Candidatus Fermentibacterales bacterium]|nr:hypothetical protein [Candidatus Fermentibacterales bacterium]
MRLLTPFACLLLLLVGCGGSYVVFEHHDAVDGCWKVTMDNNVLPSPPSTYVIQRVEFNAQRSLSNLGDVSFQFIVEYFGTSWMNIRSGMSLFVFADGSQYQLSTRDLPQREDVSSGRVSEMVVYDVTAEQMAAICRAGGVRIRVMGTGSYIETELSDKNLERLLDFCDQYVSTLPYGASAGGS